MAGGFVFHLVDVPPVRFFVSDSASGITLFQHERPVRAHRGTNRNLSHAKCYGVAASQDGLRALFACHSGEVVLVQRGAGQWKAKVVKLDRGNSVSLFLVTLPLPIIYSSLKTPLTSPLAFGRRRNVYSWCLGARVLLRVLFATRDAHRVI